jgi:hypothetical protein
LNDTLRCILGEQHPVVAQHNDRPFQRRSHAAVEGLWLRLL